MEQEELKTTKDNLKSFIERWEEHPNSPYVFDVGSNQISPINVGEDKRNGGSGLSSRGCSPSPCGSITSDMPHSEEIPQEPTPETPLPLSDNCSQIEKTNAHPIANDVFLCPIEVVDENPNKKHLKEYLHSFDRRNSDSSCLPNHSTSTSTCEKLNLADEIKKLSERLMMLSSINTDLNEYNETLTNGGGKAIKEKTPEPVKKVEKEIVVGKPKSTRIEDSSEVKLVNSRSKLSDRFSRSSSIANDSETTSTSKYSRFTRASSVISNSSSSSYNKPLTNGLSERLKSLDETPNLLQRLGNSRNSSTVSVSSRHSSVSSKTSTNAKSSSYNSSYSTNGIGSAPWPVTNKRTKFRISQMSRDVPIGSPYSHQTVFLEEAVNTTKDCLLHLLEKYNESDTRTAYSNQGRHQSIAVGYGISDNLEYRSMNSLNHFFQRHASAGNTVKQIQARIESKRKS
ncbi:hypothetical protein HA402_014125 [Bradysia odoriphaga]|nr:hypothetical protein HA402_014125 [Bradysia odoriphaga]